MSRELDFEKSSLPMWARWVSFVIDAVCSLGWLVFWLSVLSWMCCGGLDSTFDRIEQLGGQISTGETPE